MKKAWTALVLTVTLSLGLAAPAAAAGSFADVPAGTKIGNLYATDIAAVWDGAVVPSYNIGGRTAVVLQDLADYGFLVEWTPGDGVNGGRVSVTTQALPETLPSYTPEETAASGTVVGSIYATDISVEVNGVPIPAFNIGGHMAICLDSLCSSDLDNRFGVNINGNIGYSNAGFRLSWDGERHIASVTSLRPGTNLTVDGQDYSVDGLHNRFTSSLAWRGKGGQDLGSDLQITIGEENFLSMDTVQMLPWERCELEGGTLYLETSSAQKHDLYDMRSMEDIDAFKEQHPDAYWLAFSFPKTDTNFFAIPVIQLPVHIQQEGQEQETVVHGIVWDGELMVSDEVFRLAGRWGA